MATKTTETTEKAETTEDMVEVFIPRDNKSHSKEQFVSVNGVGMFVPINQKVKVPKKYAEVIENSLQQKEVAYQFMHENNK